MLKFIASYKDENNKDSRWYFRVDGTKNLTYATNIVKYALEKNGRTLTKLELINGRYTKHQLAAIANLPITPKEVDSETVYSIP